MARTTAKQDPQSLIMAGRLKDLRKRNKMSYESLQAKLEADYDIKISTASLKNYEVSTADHDRAFSTEGMRLEYLRCLADLYDVSLDYLVGRSPVESPNPDVSSAVKITGLTEHNVEYLQNPHCIFNSAADADTVLEVQTLVNDLVEICRKNMLDLHHLQMMLMVQAVQDPHSTFENGKHFSYNKCNDNLQSIGMGTIPAADGARFYAREIGDAITKGLIEKYVPD